MPTKLVIVSIDGLSPRFYLDVAWQAKAPVLSQLAAGGLAARKVWSVFPSLTYPAHATLLTGALPSEHGIYSNTAFSWQLGPRSDWNWEARRLRKPALWEKAKARGMTVGAFRWPISIGAPVDWLLPEIFDPGWNRTSQPLFQRQDEETVDRAREIFAQESPDLVMLHWVELDHAQHRSGREGIEVEEALVRVDRLLSSLLESVDLRETKIAIVGDHGFVDYDRIFHVNAFFERLGWLEAKDGKLGNWKVVAHVDGGQAAVYARDDALAREARSALSEQIRGEFEFVDRQELDARGAFPEAAFALDTSGRTTFGGNWSGELLEILPTKRGQHGGRPERDGLETGLILSGAGVVPEIVKETSLQSVAHLLVRSL